MAAVQLMSYSEHSSVSYREQKESLMMASIKTGEIARKAGEEARAPIHLCAVVDRSGSMSGQKIELVKKAMEFVIRQLKETDKFSVVSFDDRITVEFPMQQMTGSAKQAALAAVTAIRDRGSTNLSGGLFAGLDQIAGSNLSEQVLQAENTTGETPQAPTKDGTGVVSSVWLFTDGLANAGIQDADRLKTLTTRILAQLPSCTLYTFGFGKDHNESLLQQLATAGGGVYYFVEDAGQITVCFADCLGGLISVCAQNLRLKLKCSEGVSVIKVHTPFPCVTDGAQTIITMRDMYEEEERDVIVNVLFGAINGECDAWKCVEWELEYTDAVTNEARVLTAEQFVERLEQSAPNQVPPLVLDEQRNRVRSVEALDRAREAGDRGDLEAARRFLNDAIAAIGQSVSGGGPVSQGLIDSLKDSLGQLRSREEYDVKGKKSMEAYWSSHSCQRGTAKTEGVYQNKQKFAMKSAMQSFT